jgi:hypothetical protein
VIREVNEGNHVAKRVGGGWGMLDGRRFEGLMGDGYLVTKENYKAVHNNRPHDDLLH